MRVALLINALYSHLDSVRTPIMSNNIILTILCPEHPCNFDDCVTLALITSVNAQKRLSNQFDDLI